METNKQDFDLDRALTEMEREVWGPLLDATQEIKPSPEFAAMLESRLRAAPGQTSAMPAPEAQMPKAARVVRMPLFTGRGFQPAFVGVGLGLVLVAVLGISAFLGATRPASHTAREFVPPGMVRHIVMSNTLQTPGENGNTVPYYYTETTWLTNGTSHLLMYGSLSSNSYKWDAVPQMWVEDDAIYNYGFYGARVDGTVYKYAYNDAYIGRFAHGPEVLSNWKEQPDSRVMGYPVVNGHPTIEIVTVGAKPTFIPSPNQTTKETFVSDDHVWLDIGDYQIVKLHRVTTTIGGPQSGMVQTQDFEMSVDELKPTSDFPPDFFKFKLPVGAKVLDGIDPWAQASPTPEPVATPSPVPSLAELDSKFVTEGKVRHMITEVTYESSFLKDEPAKRAKRAEAWYTNGKSHLLLYNEILSTKDGRTATPVTPTLWVEDDKVYAYQFWGVPKVVDYYNFDARWVAPLAPDPQILTMAIDLPGVHDKVVGKEMLNGLQVTLVAATRIQGWDTITDTVWVDTEESRAIQWRTVTDAGDNPSVYTSTTRISVDELMDRSDFPPDFFKFKMPPGATKIEPGIAPWLTPTVVPTPATVSNAAFLAPGTARHMEFSHSWSNGFSESGRTEVVWLANGTAHPLMRLTTPDLMNRPATKERGLLSLWVEDDAVYTNSKFDDNSAFAYYKHPYDPSLVDLYMPQSVNSLVSSLGAGAHVVGDATLDNRISTTLIERTQAKPANIPAPDPSAKETWVTDVSLWVAKDTSLVLRREYTTTYLTGKRSGTVETESLRLLTNEARPESDFPQRFADTKLPPGAKVVESAQPAYDFLMRPVPAPTSP